MHILLHIMETVWDMQQHSTVTGIKKKFFVGTHINALTYTCPVIYFFGLFFYGTTTPSGPGPPYYCGFTITLIYTHHTL